MCMLIHCPTFRHRPTLATLKHCEKNNPDGMGFAWREKTRGKTRVHYFKTNDVAEIHEAAQTVPGEVVIHFRWASVGGTTEALRHPFPVSAKVSLADGGIVPAVLFQNGTWTGYRSALAEVADYLAIPKGDMSDTRAAAFLVHHFGPNFLDRINDGSRWLLFTASTTTKHGRWTEHDGMSFSNDGFRPYERREPTPIAAALNGSRYPRPRGVSVGGASDYWDLFPKPSNRRA